MSSRLIDSSLEPMLPPEFEAVRRRYPEIYTIVSPPRCSSTALARVFWEQPSIAYYCHEPFEIAYFRQAPLAEVAEKLLQPLELAPLKTRGSALGAEALVIKEMPYQVGECFRVLAALATQPMVFLLRDPRFNIASRMEKKQEVGDSPFFPLVETGWELLSEQIEYCRQNSVPHVIVSAADFRDRPFEIFPGLFSRLGLSFSERMLTWRACEDVEIDNLEGDHSHLYTRVLSSTGLTPEIAEPPALDWFPCESGFRDHVADCLEIYHALLAAPERLLPETGIDLSTEAGIGVETE